MCVETYCRENVCSSISSVSSCVLALPARLLTLGPRLFVFLIGFFCEEQKSEVVRGRGRWGEERHADVVCNQSRRRRPRPIYLGGCTRRRGRDSESSLAAATVFRSRRETRATAKCGAARHHSSRVHPGVDDGGGGRVKYVISEQMAFSFLFFLLSTVVNTVRRESGRKCRSFKYFIRGYSAADIIC